MSDESQPFEASDKPKAPPPADRDELNARGVAEPETDLDPWKPNRVVDGLWLDWKEYYELVSREDSKPDAPLRGLLVRAGRVSSEDSKPDSPLDELLDMATCQLEQIEDALRRATQASGRSI